MMIRNLTLCISLALFLNIFIFSAQAKRDETPKSLPLECHEITGNINKLCFIQTQSSYGPYDDIVFYRVDPRGYATFLGSESGSVATFGGFEFSDKGIYMWLSWAEEGHPHFEFYRTRDFLENGTQAKILQIIGDYYFDGFVSFSDSGKVVYSIDNQLTENCANIPDVTSYISPHKPFEKLCTKTILLNSNSK
ncbi:MAG: hypothetical protein OEM07_01985 [Gammaproteobacteria bacterium]|nr:hypothetical protein [Gammaproteobacteria bacterium]